MKRPLLSALGLSVALVGCGGSGEIVTGAPPEWVTPKPNAATSAQAQDAGEGVASTSSVRFEDSDFVEVETQNRDPFRSFTGAFKRESVDVGRSQRAVVMGETAVDDMRLIAIVIRGGSPFAMLTDRQGVGHVVKPRDYLGRPEVVQIGTEQTIPVQINWQVYRIREREVVLRREDPTNPDAPPLTRMIVMHEDTHDGQPAGNMRSNADFGGTSLDDQARRVMDTIRDGRGYR